MKNKILTWLALALLSVQTSRAVTVTIDPGPAGSTFDYHTFDFFDLAGIAFNGQSLSLDIIFNKPIATPQLDIDLFLNQSGSLGTWPDVSFTVSGSVLRQGSAVEPTVSIPNSGGSPAQIWPGWPFTLNGQPFFPTTTYYSTQFSGTRFEIPGFRDSQGNSGFFITPILFDEIHLDLTFPNKPDESLVGTRLTLASFFGAGAFPMTVAPDSTPTYFVRVPETMATAQLFLGAFACLVLAVRRR